MKHHILVIDDDESIRFLMQTKLFQCGYNVTLAASATHAEQVLKSGKSFDLVLCDLKMPQRSGVEVLRFLKENGLIIPTVIVTAFPEREKIIAAAQMGIHDVLVKPVRHQELLRVIAGKLGGEGEIKAA